jgi:hypothetical protein
MRDHVGKSFRTYRLGMIVAYKALNEDYTIATSAFGPITTSTRCVLDVHQHSVANLCIVGIDLRPSRLTPEVPPAVSTSEADKW